MARGPAGAAAPADRRGREQRRAAARSARATCCATRKGLTVEIGNTDAEGRLVLADLLAEGDREQPELMIDCATLTGAARVALGPDLPALFTADDALAADLIAAGEAAFEPLWRLPLHRPYRELLDSPIADINNAGSGGFAGAITGGAVPQGVRHRDQGLGPSRHLRLEPQGPPGPAEGRRGDGAARPARADPAPLRGLSPPPPELRPWTASRRRAPTTACSTRSRPAGSTTTSMATSTTSTTTATSTPRSRTI